MRASPHRWVWGRATIARSLCGLLGVVLLVSAAVVVGGHGVTVPMEAAARGFRRFNPIILGFDRTPALWTIKAKVRPTRGGPAWYLVGRIGCFDDGAGKCPARHGRVEGVVMGDLAARTGPAFTLRARFRDGSSCDFVGTMSFQTLGTYECRDREGSVTLRDELHVGLCRCSVCNGPCCVPPEPYVCPSPR